MPWRPSAALCLLSSALCLLSSCSRRETLVEAGTRTGILHMGNGAEPATLDPHLVDAYTESRLVAALFEGLTVIDERTSTAAPAAAERWETSADGLTWTFRLRAGLRWSNGEPLTADDFVQSWRRCLSPELASPYAYFFYPVKNAEAFNTRQIADPAAVGFAAPDARTVTVTLAHPTPYLPLLVASSSWYPVNPRVLTRLGGLNRRETPWLTPKDFVGNGPFVLTEWTPNGRIVTAKNPQYWDAATVRLNGIVFYPIENPDVEERNFRAGQLHVIHNLPLSKIPAYRASAPHKLRIDPFAQTIFIRFNTTRPPFDNPRLRRALSLAIDRDSITRNLLHGSRAPARRLTPPGLAGYSSRTTLTDGFAAARQLLADAGYPGGRGLPPFEIQVRNDELQPKIVEAVQAMWERELGVHAAIALLEQKTSIQNQRVLDFTVGSNGWVADYPDPATFLELFVTGGTANWTGWGDAAYDRLIAQAAQTADPAARHECFQQAEAILLEQSPIIPLIFGARNYLIDPSVKGWEPALIGLYQYKKIHLSP
ncbi:MAG: peptide ABC transporter substrate-binding protein [Opitutae bacterium]|nr:peptide ABC transporter substrate-binding protein [Opitutae bacterium]